MLSIPKIIQYTLDTKDIDILKNYYEKACDGLKKTTKRSNLISQFILILIILNFFPGNYYKLKIFEVEFDIKIIRVLTPTLLSYLIFEWLMVAKRRRDLIVALQHISYKIYDIDPTRAERFFPGFNPNTLNLMPFSLMNEVLTISTKKSFFKLFMVRTTIASIPICLFIIIIGSLIQSMTAYHLKCRFIWPSAVQDFIEEFSLYACIAVSLLFIIWTVFYYITEFENKPVYLAQIKAIQNKDV